VVLGSAARFLLQTHAQSLSNHSHGVVIMVVEPVWVALLAAGWFGETMSPVQLAGCGLIFASLLINRANLVRQWLKALF
jgi:drug/metabolite transporter (DMT)-like permease